MPAFPVMIKVWAGDDSPHDFRYIRRSLPSLLASDLPEGARVFFINDRSTDPRLEPFLQRLAAGDPRVEVWTNAERMGPNKGQAYNFPRVVSRLPAAPYYVNGDDDVIYHPGWLQRLIRVYEEARAAGLKGIFAALNIPFRPHFRAVELAASAVLLKERQPALNWLIPREVYEEVGPFRDAGIAYDTEYTNRLIALGIPVICLRPSWVQNIGYHGAYQNSNALAAPDYVGRRDLYLWARDAWYTITGHTIGRARRYFEDMPDSRSKRFMKWLVKPIRRLLPPMS